MVLVTGGLGYIGSHSVISLINSGFEVIIVDDLSNSSLSVLDNINICLNIKSTEPSYNSSGSNCSP